jgi:hypothetical protein
MISVLDGASLALATSSLLLTVFLAAMATVGFIMRKTGEMMSRPSNTTVWRFSCMCVSLAVFFTSFCSVYILREAFGRGHYLYLVAFLVAALSSWLSLVTTYLFSENVLALSKYFKIAFDYLIRRGRGGAAFLFAPYADGSSIFALIVCVMIMLISLAVGYLIIKHGPRE